MTHIKAPDRDEWTMVPTGWDEHGDPFPAKPIENASEKELERALDILDGRASSLELEAEDVRKRAAWLKAHVTLARMLRGPARKKG